MINWLHVNWLSALLRLGDFICDKMGWRRYFGFVLLVWFQRLQHVRPSDQPCSAPELNGGYLVPEQSSYDHKTTLYYGCDNGRKPAVEGWWATSTCLDGIWSPKPQCIENINSCEEPPQIPHAVIIHRGYQEIFPDSTELEYECEDGYSVEGADSKKSLNCISGNWTSSPPCSSRPDAGNAGVSTDSQKQQDTGGMSTTPGLNEGDIKPLYTKVVNCGKHQHVANGDVVERNAVFLKYQCNGYYVLVGSDTVTCNSNGRWSHLPICKEAFCLLDPARLANLKPSVNYFIKEGEEKSIPCIWDDVSRKVTCINGKMIYTLCCTGYDHYRGVCCYSTEEHGRQDGPLLDPTGSTGKRLDPKMCEFSR
ncbi:complement factor H-related protein 2-like isoform X3 [Gasterosteus aculeatus]